MLPIGPIVLTILAVLIYFGLAERVLARMRIPARPALLLVVAMLLGSTLDVDLAPGLTMNAGGGLVPVLAALWLIATAGDWSESARAVSAAVITASAVYLIGRWFPPGEPTELNLFFLDAQYLYGLTGGIVAFLAGRSRRSAFCAGVLGIFLADLVHYARFVADGARQGLVVNIGGGGFWATTVVAGVLAVLLADFLETRDGLPARPVRGDEHGRS
jgi:uncharacterized membrane protein